MDKGNVDVKDKPPDMLVGGSRGSVLVDSLEKRDPPQSFESLGDGMAID